MNTLLTEGPAGAWRPAPPRLGTISGETLDTIYRRRWPILSGAVAVTLATFAAQSLTPREFTARTTLAVERTREKTPAASIDRAVDGHLRMLASEAVLGPVSDRFLLSSVTELVRGPGVRVSGKALSLSREPGSSVIRVEYRHTDPARAAAIANSVADSYLEYLSTTRQDAWSGADQRDRERLEGVRARMEESERALARFSAQYGIPPLSDAEAEPELVAERASPPAETLRPQMAAKEAEIENLKRAVSDPARLPATATSELRAAVERGAEARQRFAEVTKIYGENYPEYKRAQAEVAETDGRARMALEQSVRRAEGELAELRRQSPALAQKAGPKPKGPDRANAERLQEYWRLAQRAAADRLIFDEVSGTSGEGAAGRPLPVRIVTRATAGPVPEPGNRLLYGALAFAGTLLLGAALAVGLEPRNPKLGTVRDLGAAGPVRAATALASIENWRTSPVDLAFPEAGVNAAGDSGIVRFRWEMDRLRDKLRELGRIQQIRSVSVVSPGRGEGRSRVAAELACAYARSQAKVLLVETGAGTDPGSGWGGTVSPALRPGTPDVLKVSAARKPGRMKRERVSALLREAAANYELVVLDAPALLGASDGLEIAGASDVAVVVARAGVTRAREFASAVGRLHRREVGIAAVLLNDAVRV